MTENHEPHIDTVPDESWTRLHRATPWLSVWQVWAVIFAWLISVAIEAISDDGLSGLWVFFQDTILSALWWILGGIVGLTVLATIMTSLAWRKKAYALTPSGVHLRHGVFVKHHRHVRWDRIHSVEIEQKLLPRLFGLGSIEVDSASGASSDLEIGLLRRDDCVRLRQEILQTAARIRGGDDTPGNSLVSEAPLAHDSDVVFQLSRSRLIGQTVVSTTMVSSLAVIATLVAITLISGEVVTFAAIVALLAPLKRLWSEFSGWWDLTVTDENDTLRISRGLTSTQNYSIFPGRVQAVKLSQPVLWRLFGWWRVTILFTGSANMADMVAEADNMRIRHMPIPAGTQNEALGFLHRVVPDLGSDNDVELLDQALHGQGNSQYFTSSPQRARLINVLGWQRNGWAITPRVFVSRSGRLNKETVITTHRAWQSLYVTQNIFQRFRHVSTMHMALTPGPVECKVSNMADTWDLVSVAYDHRS